MPQVDPDRPAFRATVGEDKRDTHILLIHEKGLEFFFCGLEERLKEEDKRKKW